MHSSSPESDNWGRVEPGVAYGIEGVARALGRTKRWVQDNLIRNNAVPYFRRGDLVMIPGWVIIQWIESDLRRHDEWGAHVEVDSPAILETSSGRSGRGR